MSRAAPLVPFHVAVAARPILSVTWCFSLNSFVALKVRDTAAVVEVNRGEGREEDMREDVREREREKGR